MFDRFFSLHDNGTTIKTEVASGITLFLTGMYILFVNGIVLSQTGMPPVGIFVATALTAAVCTLFIALYSNLPFMMAPGMGINSFFAFTICLGSGYHWKEGLCITFMAGLVHVALMLTPYRKRLIIAIPEYLGAAAGAGLGLFIAFVGICDTGLVTLANSSTPAKSVLSSPIYVHSLLSSVDVSFIIPIIAAIILLFLLAVEQRTGEKYGALPISILLTTFVCIPLSLDRFQTFISFTFSYAEDFQAVFLSFFGAPGLMTVFATPAIALKTILIVVLLSLTNILDSLGTIIGLGYLRRTILFGEKERELFEKKGAASRIDKLLIANSFGGVISGLFGSSTSVLYLESSAGVLLGGRTGLCALTAAILFLLCIPIADIFRIIPIEAVAPAMVYVGCCMMTRIRLVDWDRLEEAFPAFLILLLVPVTRTVLDGICIGITAHLIINMTLGNREKLHPTLFVVSFTYITAKVIGLFL